MTDQKPYGDVRYGDPGHQEDGVARYPLDSEAHCRAAWSYINQADNAARYTPEQLAQIKGRIKAALKRYGVQVSEAEERMTVTTDDLDEVTEAAREWLDVVREALEGSADVHGLDPDELLDIETAEGVEFVTRLDPLVESNIDDSSFARAVEAAALLYATEHPELRVTEAAAERTTEAVETIQGRVLEAKGTAPDGGRVFGVQILRYGTSKNGNQYTESVMRTAAPKYEGAKAYNHHRTAEELRSSTLEGLVGSYRNVEARQDALYGDLHLLPSAAHTAEALDATIVNQAAGLPPLVGISHDVMADFRPATSVGGRRVREAASIKAVQSADVVADPSAGGRALHAVESTQTTPLGAEQTQESEVPVNPDVLAAIRTAVADAVDAAVLSRTGTQATEAVSPPERVVENTRITEGMFSKSTSLGRLVIKDKAEQAGMDVRAVEAAVGDRFSESDVDNWIASYKATMAPIERAGLESRNSAVVTRESHDKKVKALDAFFTGDFTNGYRSFKSAYLDITGYKPTFLGSEDLNRRIIRESFGSGYDSEYERTTESADTSTWAQLLGDSVTRRVVAEYGLPQLQTWRQIVSDIQPVEDFRTQRVGRMGGYGVLPAVLQGQPYQPLTTPPDEEATYAPTKRGGTEDLTLETIANDDRRVISKIPIRLGRAAAQTLYRFVWDMLVTPVTCTYDSTALFHSNHGNTDTSSGLSQTTLGVGRQKMRDQTAYGDTSEVLGFGPKFLAVPNELEELAFQLTRSAVAVPATAAGPSDTPNINAAQGLDFILVPYLTDANDWFLIADPNVCPTIEIGFYLGRQEPEIFTQSDPSVGSVWNADVFQWKLRHIYGGTALDHRAFYRGQG